MKGVWGKVLKVDLSSGTCSVEPLPEKIYQQFLGGAGLAFCGGCRARADGYTGDMLAGDPGCIYNRHMWDEITNLQEYEPELLYNLAASSEIESRDEIGREVLT